MLDENKSLLSTVDSQREMDILSLTETYEIESMVLKSEATKHAAGNVRVIPYNNIYLLIYF